MPSKKRSDPNPTPEPTEAATGVVDPDPDAWAAASEQLRAGLITTAESLNVEPVAEGTATRSPNPLAGRHAYKVLQAIHHDGARVRPGEIVVLSPTSGLARSPFVRLIEDEPPPPEIAAALAEAEDG